jgi:uncharacterized membrane protein
MTKRAPRARWWDSIRVRLGVTIAAGVVATVVAGRTLSWVYAPLTGWGVACVIYMADMWRRIGPLDADGTHDFATRKAPGRAVMDLTLIGASVASLLDLVYVLVQARDHSGTEQTLLAVFAVVSVGLSWGMIHTLFTLRYAHLYHTGGGGIDFNQDEPPSYRDFAYVAFTLGMTYQVSDTNISSPVIRATVLRHSLLSYVFGAVVLAATVNLVVGLIP